MTVMAFLDAVAATPRTWRILPSPGTGQRLIRNDRYNCPYLAVAEGRDLTGPGAVPWEDVFDAADDAPTANPTIRRALLDACGLEAAR